MIISASRRTDIPAFYSDWFFNRLSEGFVYVKNPMNPHQISKIVLSKSLVDCFVFWTKNPLQMMDKLDLLSDYHYYFQFTITPYNDFFEPNLPPKTEIINTFKNLSNYVGLNRIIWRYDPIILTNKYSIDYHFKAFKKLTALLASYTKRCVISFVDLYRKSKKNLTNIDLIPFSDNYMHEIASCFVKIANDNGIELVSCSEKIDLNEHGISHGKCIDDKLIEEISGYELDLSKDKTQRPECGCVGSIDIGSYNTCPHGCLYCYANYDIEKVKLNFLDHDKSSPLLFGKINENDNISNRKVQSCRVIQQKFL